MTLDVVQLPVLPPSVALAMNSLTGRQWSLPLACADHDGNWELIDISLRGPPTLTAALPRLHITISSRFGCFALSFELELCNALSDITLAGWREEKSSSLEATWRAVLIMTRLARTAGLYDGIESIDSALQWATEAQPPPFSFLGGAVRIQDKLFAFNLAFLSVPTAAFERFASLADAPSLTGIDPGFLCALHLPSRTIDISDYTKLGIGDLLLIAATSGDVFPVAGSIPDILHFSGTLHIDGSVRILRADLQTEAFAMTKPTEVQPETQFVTDMPTLGTDAVSALPIKIDVLLKTRRLSLAELRALAPGYTLDLQIDLAAPVRLFANGAAIGSGYLLQLGDHLGVQIARWPTHKVSPNE